MRNNTGQTCTICKIYKPFTYYHFTNRIENKRATMCKICRKEYDLVYRQSEKVQNYYHSQEYKARKKKQARDGWLYRLWLSAKHRAKYSNLEFTINKEDIIVNKVCPFFEVPIGFNDDVFMYSFSPSLDRIDNSKGYIPGNVWIISRLANTMKNKASLIELVTFAKSTIKLERNGILSNSKYSTNNASSTVSTSPSMGIQQSIFQK